MKWTLAKLGLIVATVVTALCAALPARGDYLTFDIASHEAMADYTRFESRSWAEGAEGEGGRLSANATWSGGEHVILNDLYVPSGVTLTINAGTVVKFREGTRIKLEDGGNIVLNGELGNEVVFEGYEDNTSFKGIVLQSGSAGYSDNCYVIVRGVAFGKFATVNISDTEAFKGGGQALVPVNVSGSRDTAFSFDWVAETNGVQFASGTMNWSRVSDGSKNITVPYPDGLPGCSNFTVRATTLRCCTASKGACVVNLSEFITTQIYTHEAMADYISFECRAWTEGLEGDGGRLSSNVVWIGTHKIVSDVYIPSGVTLTLSADTIVEFCEGTRIKIEDGGKLEIVGAEGHDVILRGADGVTSFGGIVKMSNGTFFDNSYVQAQGWTYNAFAGVSMHDSSTFRSSGLALIPVSVSGSRSTSFSIDWIAETNGVAYKTGTMKWNNVSEGRKNIILEYGSELDGLTNFTVRVAVERACHASPDSCNVKISDFETVDIYSHEAMADYIAFESREWAAELDGEGGRLDGNATWSGTHKIVSDVYIPSGVTLNLTADTVVEFCEGTRIKIEDGGTLKIVGAEGHDVIFRGAPGVTNYIGIVRMSNGTYTDNMYVQFTDKPYSAYPYVALHEATTYREAGKLYIPVTLSGTSRNQSFNMDWHTDKGDHGTVTWSSSSDGTKWIQIPVDATPVGGKTNHIITITAARGCNISVGEKTLTILEPDYSVKGQVAIHESDEDSGEFAVNGDIKTQPLFLNPVERVQYSGKWQAYDANEAAVLRVTLETDNGLTLLKEVSPSETGAFELDLAKYPVGCYTLKHAILDEFGETLATMQKTFSIADDEDVVMHGGTLTQNETWEAGKVHVVYQTVVVPSIYTIFIEPGAIVKFMTGTGIDISQGGAFFANGIVFTHINDDTVGGDTLSDGYTVAPPMDAYTLSGNFTFGDDTELRGITQNSALAGTISAQKTLSRGSTYRVSGTLTIASGGALTIPPGTVLKMESGAAIVVNSGATLNAIGTRAAPIVITSIKDDSVSGDTNGDGVSDPQPGDWKEIKCAGGTINMEYATILYGGKNGTNGDVFNMIGGAVTFNNSVLAHAFMYGVALESGSWAMTNSVFCDFHTAFRHFAPCDCVNSVFYDMTYLSNNGGQSFRNCVISGFATALCWWADNCVYENCVIWNPTGFGPQESEKTGSNGNIWGDPLFVGAANGDFRIREGSPCVDAADSAVAPDLDYYGQPRITITDGGSGTNLVGQLADIGICEVMPRDVVSDIDLVPQSVRTTTNAVPGQLLFVKWEIANVGGAEVNAAWRDTVSLVSENGREVVLGDKTTTSRVAVGGSVFCSGYFTVPAISEGKWYPKVNVNSYHDIFEGSLSANNALVGERAVSVGLEVLDPSISREGVINAGTPTVLKFAFGEDDANRMVVFDVPNGVTATWGFGFMPQGASKSGAMTAAGDGVMFKVPDGATEVYVVLESDATATYNLFAESAQMVITGVSPAALPSSGTTTLTITGAGFDDACEVALVSTVGRVVLNAPQKDSSGSLIATVDCATLTAGITYNLVVASDNNLVELPSALTVTKAEGKGNFWVNLVLPEAGRTGRDTTAYIEYGNSGNCDIKPQVISVEVVGDAGMSRIGDVNTFNPLYFVLVGAEGQGMSIRPGESFSLPFTIRCGKQTSTFDLYYAFDKDVDCSPWSSKAEYEEDICRAILRLKVAGQDVTNYDSVYAEAENIRNHKNFFAGRVINQDGAGAEGAIVALNKITETGEISQVGLATSDSEGRFAFCQLSDGTFSIELKSGGRLLTCNPLSVVELSGGIDYLGAEIVVDRSSKLVVKLDDTHEGRAAVMLSYVNGDFPSTPVLFNASENSYVSYDVPTSGLFRISASYENSEAIKNLYIVEGTELSLALVLRRKMNVAGRLEQLDVARLPGESVFVEAFNISNCVTYLSEVNTNTSCFTFVDIPEGDYVLNVNNVSCCYDFADVYSFSYDTVENVVIAPLITELTVNYPEAWGSDYAIVISDNMGVTDVVQADNSGKAKFMSVRDGRWSWVVLRVDDGSTVDSGTWEVKENQRIVSVANAPLAFLNSRKPLLGGIWDTLEMVGGWIWQKVRDTCAEWISATEWANKFIDMFQSDSYIQGMQDLDNARSMLASIRIENPVNCPCGYNKRKYKSDRAALDSAVAACNAYSSFLRQCDNMKLVANSFKLVGDGAETLGKWYIRIKNLAFAKRLDECSGALSMLNAELELGIGGVAFSKEFANAVKDLESSVDRVNAAIKAADGLNTILAALNDTVAICNKIIGDKRARAMVDKTGKLSKVFTWAHWILDGASDAIAILSDIVTVNDDWKSWKNGVEEFPRRRHEFALAINGLADLAATFNIYHDNDCNEPNPRQPRPGIGPFKKPIIVESFDPNEMVGPVGLGDPETERLVKPGEELTYTIYFENKSDATAAAQEVYVTNPLSEWLDWSTFKMGEVAFNNQIDLGLSGKPSGSSEATMKGTNFLVRTTLGGGCDGADSIAASGVAHWYLRIVDPTTDTGWPKDILAGFLPPNDETFRGEGHLTYTIKVREDAPPNLVITNSATIVFDYNDPIETDPAWWNTVAPTVGETRFCADETSTIEGSNAVIRVFGGNAYVASSVQVYLTYNTAAAADLDLANAALDGETPKGGLKFPLTLSWAKGEIGERVVTIPVKVDKTVEDAEFFTLQLAAPQGLALGDATVCTVTIGDLNNKELKAAVTAYKPKAGEAVATNHVGVAVAESAAKGGFTAGTGDYTSGSKLTLTAEARPGWAFVGWRLKDGGEAILSDKAKWQVVVTNDEDYVAVFEKIPYVRGLADPADGGKVSGSGLCAAGKKVTLKATTNKNFTFLGWVAGASETRPYQEGEFVATTASLVIDRTAKPAANSKTSTTITNVAEDVTYYAVFKSDPEVFVTVDATDGIGAEPTGKGAGKYVAGTITGMGKYAPGKKVTLKAAANKGYVFAGWACGGRGATALPDDVISQAASWSFEMPSNDVEYVAMFVTADEDKASIALGVNGEEMRLAGDGSPHQTNLWCGVYLEWPVAASALSETKVKVAGLPSGLKFTDKPVTAKIGSGKTAITVTNVPANTIYGAPTAASKTAKDRKTGALTVTPSAVKFTVTTAGKSTQTYQIDTVVDALPAWAQGTFAGGLFDGALGDRALPCGTVSLTVDAKGKTSGKALGDDLIYTLAAPYYAGFEMTDGVSNFLADVTATWSYKEGTKTIKTNEVVEVVVQDNGIGGVATGGPLFSSAAQPESAPYHLMAWQYNWKVEPWKALGKSFDKTTMVYAIGADGEFIDGDEAATVALSEEVPGRVTLKFAASGAVTIAGEFVTGYTEKTKKYATVKATGSATLVPVDEEKGEVFIYLAPKGFLPHARCIEVPWPQE